MAALPNEIDLDDEGMVTRIVARAKRNPFLAVGILGFATTLGIGAYRFKNRSKAAPMSLFFIQLRVTAQCVIIGTLTVGLAYNMLNEYVFKEKNHPGKRL